jgi:hypothetical protein
MVTGSVLLLCLFILIRFNSYGDQGSLDGDQVSFHGDQVSLYGDRVSLVIVSFYFDLFLFLWCPGQP